MLLLTQDESLWLDALSAAGRVGTISIGGDERRAVNRGGSSPASRFSFYLLCLLLGSVLRLGFPSDSAIFLWIFFLNLVDFRSSLKVLLGCLTTGILDIGLMADEINSYTCLRSLSALPTAVRGRSWFLLK